MISTGNTKVPSYLTILKKGYGVSLSIEDNMAYWTADNGQLTFIANDLDKLLGIITMWEIRGENWKASQSEISGFFKAFPKLKQIK